MQVLLTHRIQARANRLANLRLHTALAGLTDEELQGEFAAFGNVTSARIVKDRETNRSRGFGFVEMPVESEALTAISRNSNAVKAGTEEMRSSADQLAERVGVAGHVGGEQRACR